MKKVFTNVAKLIKDYRPPKFLIVSLFVAICIYFFFQKKVFDNDTWFILNHGRYVFEHGIPHIEPFTIHDNLKFVMQQWLTSCIFWFVYKYLKMLGLKMLMTCIYSLAIFLMYKLCMLVSNKKFYLSFLVTTAFSILILVQTILRPQVFDVLIFLIEIYVLELYIRRKNSKYLIALPILSLLLINLHASMWFMSIAFMIPYIIDSFKLDLGFIKGEGYQKKPLFIALLIVILVGFINPYGIDAITYVFRSYGIKEINGFIREMKPVVITRSSGKLIFGTLFVVLSILVFNKSKKVKLRYYLLFLGTVFLGLSQVRNFYLLLIGILFPISDLLSENFNEYHIKHRERHLVIVQRFIIVLMLFIMSLILYKPVGTYLEKSSESVDYIIKNYDVNTVRVYTSYRDGAYAEFMGLKCYIDPRAEVFLKSNNGVEDIYIEYYDLQTKKNNMQEFLEKYKFDLLILDETDALTLYEDKEYKIVHKDKYREVYELIKKE